MVTQPNMIAKTCRPHPRRRHPLHPPHLMASYSTLPSIAPLVVVFTFVACTVIAIPAPAEILVVLRPVTNHLSLLRQMIPLS